MSARGNSISSRDIAHYLHPYTNFRKHEQDGPLVVTRGEGVYVYDETGKKYLEAMASLWCASLGFSERRLVDAAYQQMLKLPTYNVFAGKTTDVGVDLAEKVLSMAPVPMSKVFFVNSGSEANDTVVKMVWYYNNAIGRPKKKKIISRLRGYHGVTVASASLTGLPNNHRDFDLPIAGILHTECPHHYRNAQPGESEEDFATRMADALEKMIEREGADTVAAFIAEPVMGAGGVVVPPRTYFDKIQAVLKKHDVLFIADEVICGFGRTGNMWGSQTFNIKPDIISMAKALSAAYMPIAGVMINDKVYQGIADNSAKIGTFGHGYTYGGHPVSSAVALETMKIYEERDIIGHIKRVGPRLQAGLRKFADHPLVGEVRGVGLVAGVELVKNKATKEAFDPKQLVGGYLSRRAQEHGLIARGMMDTLAITPPLIITESEVDELLTKLGRALDDTLRWVNDQGLASVAD
jgi:4-aminobutyrate--pyruvate transaminase